MNGVTVGLVVVLLILLAFGGWAYAGYRAGRTKERELVHQSDTDAVVVAHQAEAGVDRMSSDDRRKRLLNEYGRVLSGSEKDNHKPG